MKKSIFTIVCLLSFIRPATVNAQGDNISVWNGTKSRFEKGIGIESDPYIISTAEQFAYLSDGGTYEGKYFSVEVDLDLANLNWTPIGAFEEEKFKGNIDFNAHTIYHLNVDGDRAMGLFGYIENATITNLILKDSNVKGLNLVGGVVANAKNSSISNIENYSSVQSTGGLASVGGIIGIANSCNVYNVLNYGIVSNEDEQGTSNSSTQSHIGGVIGTAESSTVSSCGNLGDVTAYSVIATARYFTAGIVGNNVSSNISYCFNTGDITCRLRYVRWYNDGTISYVAGISNGGKIEDANSNDSPMNCYNTGVISGCSYWSGSYAGISSSYYGTPCVNCYSTWNIVGCEAKSYTCSLERNNGVKVTQDELNSTAIVNQLNNGSNVFSQDVYPYINSGLPFLNGIKRYNIKTEVPTDITSTSALIKGAVICSGYEIQKRGFSIRPISSSNYSTIFSFNNEELIDNLSPNQRYCYYFFAELTDGKIIKGEEIEFTTKSLESEIYTIDAENITSKSAEIKGAIILNGNENLIDVGVEYSTLEGNMYSMIGSMEDLSLPYFLISLTELEEGTSYRYRVFARLDKGVLYGDYKTFKTPTDTSIQNIANNTLIIERNENGIVIKNGYGKPFSVYTLSGLLIVKGRIGSNHYSIKLPKGIYLICGKKVKI